MESRRAVLENGRVGEVYNLGDHNEKANIDIVKIILAELGKQESLITFVTDRKGHVQRYAIDPSKAMAELGWAPTTMFKDSIKLTIQWYKDHMDWMRECTYGEYVKYYEEMYGGREAPLMRFIYAGSDLLEDMVFDVVEVLNSK